MYKKIIITIITIISVFNINVGAKNKTFRYLIIGDSNNNQEVYKLKDDLIYSFQAITTGLDETYFEQTIIDYIKDKEDFNYASNTITIVLGDGKGQKLEGELKTNYCENKETIKTRVFLFELFN
jgi:hypothetical protein